MTRQAPRFLQALNPAIYLVSVLPGIVVWLLAGATGSNSLVLAMGTVGVVLIQHAVNLFNDAKDWRLGADVDKQDSWVRVHHGDPAIANRHALISFVTGAGVGLYVLIQSQRLWIVLYALPFVVAGLLYNFGKRPLSYTRAGEWLTGLCYGPGVFGSLWLLAGEQFDAVSAAGMLAFAALSMSLLFSHQPPQIETDRAAGKNSFAVRHGADHTYRASVILFAVAFTAQALALGQVGAGWFTASMTVCLGLLASWKLYVLRAGPKHILIHASLIYVAIFLLKTFSDL